jgi:undecaprenyl diphosphate synthase
MTEDNSDNLPESLAGIPRQRWPRHIAVIMDGNGRWARRGGLPRFEGHRRGAETVRKIVEEASRLDIRQITLYAFSHENWRRPKDEIETLMDLYVEYLRGERGLMMEQNIRFSNIGRHHELPERVQKEVADTERMTGGNSGTHLCMAVNYGGRQEIVDAARQVAREVAAGTLAIDAIDEKTIGDRLYPAGRDDVDLLIRTAGEMRVSNFLLWQISYAELHVTETLWPDFTEGSLHEAIVDFVGRQRRFGGLDLSGEAD